MSTKLNGPMTTAEADTKPKKSEPKQKIPSDAIRTIEALSLHEPVQRFGSANAEYIKGYRGYDNETGQRFAKGLADIAKHKVNDDPRYAAQNIKQQAGFSAEVLATSRDNADAIINKSKVRTSRTDDLPDFGKNHTLYDRVKLENGKTIGGFESQMKFVDNRNQLLDDIARENGKFSRYRGTKIELPTEQYEGNRDFVLDEAKKLKRRAEQLTKDPSKAAQAAKIQREADKLEAYAKSDNFQPESAADRCRKQAQRMRRNADKAEANGNPEKATKLRKEAANYEELAENVRDSGVTREEAIRARTHPRLTTAKEIIATSHKAGVEGAKYGALIGGIISTLTNSFSVVKGEKEIADALPDVGTDTLKAAAAGYATGFSGSAIKAGMQQSGNSLVRKLSTTSAPALMLNACLSLGGSVKRFVTGEISEAQLLTEVGEKGAGMLSASMMTVVGQLAIPVPLIGAAIGGMIGYTLSSMFYQSALAAAKDAQSSREQLSKVRAIEAAARERIAFEKEQLTAFVSKEIPQLRLETQQFISKLSDDGQSGFDVIAESVNDYAQLLGRLLEFQSLDEFTTFMSSDTPLTL